MLAVLPVVMFTADDPLDAPLDEFGFAVAAERACGLAVAEGLATALDDGLTVGLNVLMGLALMARLLLPCASASGQPINITTPMPSRARRRSIKTPASWFYLKARWPPINGASNSL